MTECSKDHKIISVEPTVGWPWGIALAMVSLKDVNAFRTGGWFLSRQLLANDEVKTVAATLTQLTHIH